MKLKPGIIIIFLFVFVNVYSQVRITEVMYDPISPAKEWFEIMNVGSGSVSIQNWSWKDASLTGHMITMRGINLNPNEYAIVCEDSINLKQNFPNVSGYILQSFGWNNLNNTGYESVILYNFSGQMKDSLMFHNSWGGDNGFSLEKIDPPGPTNLQTNWGTCVDPLKGTPNRINSITPKLYDLTLKSFNINPAIPLAGDSLILSFTIKNIGINPATNFSLNIYRDINSDSIPQQSEIINTQSYTNLNPNDSIKYNYSLLNNDTGLIQFIGIVDFPPDLDTMNNKLLRAVQIYNSIQGLGLIVNEVMYANTTTTEKEWFEIYNRDSVPISLSGVSWKDASTTSHLITSNNISLSSHQYAVICQDSISLKQHHPEISGLIFQTQWSTLNDDGDDIVLFKTVTGQRFDSLHYLSLWGGNGGYSLERIDANGPTNNQSNWGTSIDLIKSTPDRKNSITPKPYDLFLKNFTITPAIPIAGDSLKLAFTIKNIGINSANNYSLNIYRDNNLDSIPQTSELLHLQNFFNLNPYDSVRYNFAFINQDTGIVQIIGSVSYQSDEDTLNNKLIKSVIVSNNQSNTGLVINEIMYSPKSPEPEWVELYNNSSTPINIKNWKIADSSTLNNPLIITSNDYYIQNYSFLVIAKNNSIIPVHPSIDSSKVIYMSNLPTLNNDKDVVAIYNNSGIQMDYVSFKSGWGGSSKFSLERISVNYPSSDSSNWGTSLDCEYSSPTRTNSYNNINTYSRNDLIVNEIMFNPITGDAEWFELYNPTNKTLNLSGWKFSESSSYYNLFDSCNLIIKPGDYLIVAGDTNIYKRFQYLRNLSENQKIIFVSNMSLSNEGELLKIYDVKNNVIDSVYYNSNWHNPNVAETKGFSLERINPLLGSNDRNNWTSSVNSNGGTPGLINSVYINNSSLSASKISINPNPFSPDGDGMDDATFINYKLSVPISQIRIKIYDVKGRLVRNLVNNQLSGNQGTIIFNGYDDNNQRLRLGIYIVFLEAIDSKGGVVDNAKTTVVIATKL